MHAHRELDLVFFVLFFCFFFINYNDKIGSLNILCTVKGNDVNQNFKPLLSQEIVFICWMSLLCLRIRYFTSALKLITNPYLCQLIK